MSDTREAGSGPEHEEFRERCRKWLARNKPVPPGFRLPQSALEVMTEEQRDYLQAWQKKCYEVGLVGCDYPIEYGGGGKTGYQRIANQEMARAGATFLINLT